MGKLKHGYCARKSNPGKNDAGLFGGYEGGNDEFYKTSAKC